MHAALQTAESMEPLAKLPQSAGFRIVAPDQRGHGRSANPGRTLSIPMLVDDIIELMDHLAIASPVLIGYSLGGIVALELATRGVPSGLVTLAARAVPIAEERTAFDPADIQRRSPLWARQLSEKHEETPWRELALELGRVLSAWPGIGPGALASIQSPTLVVQGDRDQMVPVAQARLLADSIPGAQLLVVPHVGHPELLYRQEVVQAVGAFLAQLHGSSRGQSPTK
ncbi:MAG: alpha/beta fold hydrolase [Mycobacterium leprae]